MLRVFLSITMISISVAAVAEPTITKQKDIIIYRNESFYSAFPSIVKRDSGELIVAFRRAPDRRVFGEGGSNHTDPNSYLVLVRSTDNGETWTTEPELILAHPFGGSQDPCMIQLADGSIVCSSYGWSRVDDKAKAKFPDSLRHDNFVFMGGYMVRSEDGGKTWGNLIVPPPVPGSATENVFGGPAPAYNRGAMVQDAKTSRLYWAVCSQRQVTPRRSETHLMISDDRGDTWKHSSLIAADEDASFNETSLTITPKGDIVAFMRTADFDDQTVVARSTDGGKSFQKWEAAGWQGHPHYALRLPDQRVLLIYGYRHKPFGVRARVLNPECTDFKTAPEMILRDDGTRSDLGYPWATLTEDGRILVTYYFHDDTGNRHIAGTYLTISD